MEMSSRNFSRPQVIENSRQYLLLGTDILTENSRWVSLPFRLNFIKKKTERCPYHDIKKTLDTLGRLYKRSLT